MIRGLRGFTLIELIITLTLASILVALGVPAMRTLIQENRQAGLINDILVSLSLARAEAVKRGASTVMCISDGATPANCSGSSNRWEEGWIVFVDGDTDRELGTSDPNGNGRWDIGEDWLLLAHEPFSGDTTLRGNTRVARKITYDARGFSGNNGTLRLCDGRGPEGARGIVINNTGRPRRSEDSNGDGVVEDGEGNNLGCP